MDDKQIIEFYWHRSERAIEETAKKYSRYCRHIALAILHDSEDAEECLSDTYLRAWNTIPPQRPTRLSAFLGKITRNLSLDKLKFYNTEKRGSGQVLLALSELEEVIPAATDTEQIMDEKIVIETLNRFLEALPREKRIVFVQRYWYLSPVKEIAAQSGMGESKVKSMLLRLRNELRQYLEKEGIII